MFSIFWKSLFSSLMIFFLFSNIAFACDLIGYVNASPIPLNPGDAWTNYYFGVSSFIDAFKVWFGENSALSGFAKFMNRLGDFIGHTMNILPTRFFSSISTTGGILALIANIILWTNSVLPFIFGAFYVVMFLVYIIFLAFQVGAFVIYWFGGGFLTPLPGTDWYNSYTQYGNSDWSAVQEYWNEVFGL